MTKKEETKKVKKSVETKVSKLSTLAKRLDSSKKEVKSKINEGLLVIDEKLIKVSWGEEQGTRVKDIQGLEGRKLVNKDLIYELNDKVMKEFNALGVEMVKLAEKQVKLLDKLKPKFSV